MTNFFISILLLVPLISKADFTNVCGRSDSAIQALEKYTGKSCSEIGPQDIRDLPSDFTIVASGHLVPGDLDGFQNPSLKILVEWEDEAYLDEGLFHNLPQLKSIQILPLKESARLPVDAILPRTFEGLENLESLEITSVGVDLFPGVLEPLTGLKTLILAGNSFSHLDPEIFRGLTSLETLNMTDNTFAGYSQWPNQFDTFEKEQFHHLSHLKNLKIGDLGLKTLSQEVFDGISDLEFLDISYLNLKTLSQDIFAVLPKLRVVDVRGNPDLDVNALKGEYPEISFLY